jgi:lysine 2,3-aminomutase
MTNRPVFLKPWGKIPSRDWTDWRWQYRNRSHTMTQLALLSGMTPESIRSCRPVVAAYPYSITPYYLSLMDVADPGDPLQRQCIPHPDEIRFSLGGLEDPLEERRDMPVPGLIRRYADRCLILSTNACATYCRHCNRKRLWKDRSRQGTKASLRPVIRYIAGQPRLREVIVSGGDPLVLPDGALDWLLTSLRSIPHVEVIRIGSRAPVVMPMRITRELCRLLRRHRPLWFNTQFNHSREVTEASARACGMLLESGIPVSNQSVLLRGVNDSCEAMRDLLHSLQRISVRPYYLFHCDAVKGTDHFRVDMRHGMGMMEQLRRGISGLCMPRYVVDLPGGMGKLPLQPFAFPSCPIAEEEQHYFDKNS